MNVKLPPLLGLVPCTVAFSNSPNRRSACAFSPAASFIAPGESSRCLK